MQEKLTSRVGRIISASLHALVDAIENATPESVMEQAIREIDGAIDDVRAELGTVIAAKHLANGRLMDENRRYEDLVEKIELAIAQRRDDLAEAAIAQQLDIEAQIPVLESRIKECADNEKELESFINALQAKKRQMREDLRQYREVNRQSSGSLQPGGDAVSLNVDEAHAAFERVMDKAAGAGTGRALSTDAAKLAELEDMTRNHRIKERLNAVKNKALS